MRSAVSLAIAAALCSSGIVACSGAHSSSSLVPKSTQSTVKHVRHLKNSSSNGTRSIKDFQGGPMFNMNADMMDAPLVGTSGVAHFNVGVLGVDAIDQNGDSWQLTGSDTPQVYDLLALRTTAVSLGSGSLPAGTYPSVQLLLDPGTTTLTLNGQTLPVYFVTTDHPWWDPTQTVEAVNIPLTVSGNNGDQLTATLDFNVFQSADVRDGAVYLTPTVAAGFGQPAIDGTVVNAAGQPVQNATVIATDANGNVANVTATAADGTFELHGINPGGYTVSVVNTFTTNAGDVVTAVGADAGGAPSQYVVVGPNSKVQLGSLQD